MNFKKEVEYKDSENNYVIENEITVTITLNEYRKLVSDSATMQRQIDEANNDKYARNNENDKLKNDIGILKAENYELKKQIEELLCVGTDLEEVEG